jgi:protein ImuB
VRWHLTGWLERHNDPTSGSPGGPTAGVVQLRLAPIEVVPTGAHQQALWGGSGGSDERTHRALARVQTLLGHGSVLTPVLDGGRDPGRRTRLVPWGDAPPPDTPQQPWPGALPAPAPSVLFDPPRPARVLDEAGHPVLVTERGAMPRPPANFGLGDERPVAVTSWAGPWPVDERWWSPDTARRVVRCQLVDIRGRAYLVSGIMLTTGARWQVDALYD